MNLDADFCIQRLMLFDLSINGHHPAYIQHLIQWWGKNGLPFALDIVVSPKFIEKHSDVVDLAAQYHHCSICFIPIEVQEEKDLKPRNLGGIKRIHRSFQEWKLLCRYAKKLKSDHCLILYFDPYQLSLIFAEPSPCPISGIYFRPTFHYQDFIQCRLTWRDHIQQVKEKLLLKQLFRNSKLKILFSLDPFVVNYIEKIKKQVQILPLPDPVVKTSVSSLQIVQLREKLRVEKERKICLIFGALTGRKGIYETLDSIVNLSDEIQKKICILLVGQANLQDQKRIASKIEEISSVCFVQMISQFEFIGEPEVPVYFQMADVILAPYQHHIGMSGILLQAASAGKPVLSSNFGLMGEMVKQHCLGLAIDSSSPLEISKALSQLLMDDNEKYFNLEKMKIFVENNSADRFSRTILDNIFQV